MTSETEDVGTLFVLGELSGHANVIDVSIQSYEPMAQHKDKRCLILSKLPGAALPSVPLEV